VVRWKYLKNPGKQPEDIRENRQDAALIYVIGYQALSSLCYYSFSCSDFLHPEFDDLRHKWVRNGFIQGNLTVPFEVSNGDNSF